MKFKCPNCQHTLKAPPNSAGKRARCKHCHTQLVIPTPSSPAPTPRPSPTSSGELNQRQSLHADRSEQPDEWAQDLPEFLAVEKPVSRQSSVGEYDNDPFATAESSNSDGLLESPSQLTAADDNLGPAMGFGSIVNMEGMIQQAVAKEQSKKNPKITVAQIDQAFHGELESSGRTFGYGFRVFLVALLMLGIPTLFILGVVVGSVQLVSLVGSLLSGDISGPPIILVFVVAVIGGVLLLALWIPVLNMLISFIALLFAGSRSRPEARVLTRESQPVLYEFVDQICTRVGAPKPARIELDCDFNASASFRRGWLSFGQDDLVLTLGVPLIAAMTAEQLASVMAHEFGHFRQRRGMRASFLIRTLVGWFMVAAHQDEEAERQKFHDPNSNQSVEAVIDSILWLSRMVMLGLGYAGHAVSAALSRDMEYDADRYAISVAGSKAFIGSMNRLERFAFAYFLTLDNLQALFFRGVCIDNIPRMMMHVAKTMPASVVQKIAKENERRRQQLMDSHPPSAERSQAAKELAEAGILRLPRPATDLVDHWVQLCEHITLDFYSQVSGHKITKEQVNKLEDVLRDEHKLLLDRA